MNAIQSRANRVLVTKLALVVVGMFGFEAVGALWIRKIVNFDF